MENEKKIIKLFHSNKKQATLIDFPNNYNELIEEVQIAFYEGNNDADYVLSYQDKAITDDDKLEELKQTGYTQGTDVLKITIDEL